MRVDKLTAWLRCLLLGFCLAGSVGAFASPWGANYFPNTLLTTHEGTQVRFFDDLIKDKTVVINFIYTACPDTCPLETAQLIRVQQILGKRLGKDVFFYSISIDPKTDTPEVLSAYRSRFGAKWTFLTGNEAEISELRRKLGLYIEEIQDGSFNHNVSMIIGNQRTGRWMKRSPFENPYVLADQIGNWLNDWKSAKPPADYAGAPKLRNVSSGEQLFRTRCQNCHSIGGTGRENEGQQGGKATKQELGPDLFAINQRREQDWLVNWIMAPDQMLKNKDPIAMALYRQYNRLAMPNMRLTHSEVHQILAFIRQESERLTGLAGDSAAGGQEEVKVVKITNAWVRQALPEAQVNAGYMTLINPGDRELTLVQVESDAFNRVEIHEMAMVDGLMVMYELDELSVPAYGRMALLPGGKHLMLKSPIKPLSKDDSIALTLIFKSGQQQKVFVKVAKK
ncbi:copper chaperone PCu(A)C [Thalassomonas viridans]|uniref:Copper chaperone PCu(A)C n=1 Tax=Thalassomonas viridans TaxID=137584 RepID=A0AAF0C7I5_9GAMM|nr:copper chaperone PCu(A)C [Thalassomonas viridans]WDE03210.1 copper chaperone PCu(A)C [Thalassomonas viridans]